YLRELNQRLVYRLVNQVEELKRLNQHFVRRAAQLADLHRAVQDITSELGVQAMLEQLLPNLSRALGTTQLAVDIADADVHEEVLQRFTELVRTRLRVDVVRIWLHDAGTEYRLAAQAGLAEKPGLAQMQFAPGEGAVGWIMEHLTPLQLPDLQVDPRFRERAWAQAEGLLSFVGVPLMLDDVPIGVLLCWTRQRREFTSD